MFCYTADRNCQVPTLKSNSLNRNNLMINFYRTNWRFGKEFLRHGFDKLQRNNFYLREQAIVNRIHQQRVNYTRCAYYQGKLILYYKVLEIHVLHNILPRWGGGWNGKNDGRQNKIVLYAFLRMQLANMEY